MIITKSFKKCSISNDLDGTEDDLLWAEQYDKSEEGGDNMYDEMVTHEQIQQMFSEESDDDEFWGFESVLLILMRLIHWFDYGGLVLNASYTRVCLIHWYIL